jgi:N-acetylneuraminic acid mutarotase
MPRLVLLIAALCCSIVLSACAPASSVGPVMPTSEGGPSIGPTSIVQPTPSGPVASASPVVSDPASVAPSAVTWARLEVNGPSAREDHTWTVDGAGRYAYLFGGRAGSKTRGDLWRFDLDADSWHRLEPEGTHPKARFGHAAVWVEGVGLVVWAGQAGAAFFDDLWAYDPEADAWHKLPSTGAVPEARYGSCALLGEDGRLWISHGFTDRGRFFDTRAYDFAAGRWTNETPKGGLTPVERCLHDCVWAADGRLLLYAGQTTGVPALADLWAFDTQAGSWTEQKPSPKPDARQLYALATDGHMAWVLGGTGKDRAKLDDLWALDVGTLAWRRIEVAGGPSARSGATLIADAARGRLLLFGGVSAKEELRDTWQVALPVGD